VKDCYFKGISQCIYESKERHHSIFVVGD